MGWFCLGLATSGSSGRADQRIRISCRKSGDFGICESKQGRGLACFIAKQKLGPPVVPFYHFLGEGSPTQIDYNKKVPFF